MIATAKRFTERDARMEGRVDAEAGILYGVKLLGERSANGRRYLPEAMREAVPLYEGKKCYVDHPDRDRLSEDRKFEHWAGVYRNVRYREGLGLFGDLHLLKSSGYFESIIDAALNFPNSLGLSHVADGESHLEGGDEIVESIDLVCSVDLVMDPATTAGLFEGVDNASDRQTNRYTKSQQDSIAKLADDARKLRTLAVSRMAVAHGVDSPKPMGDLLRDLVQFGGELTAWLGDLPAIQQSAPAAAARRILQSLNEMFTSPLESGGPDAARGALDALVEFVEDLAGRPRGGETFQRESWRRALGLSARNQETVRGSNSGYKKVGSKKFAEAIR